MELFNKKWNEFKEIQNYKTFEEISAIERYVVESGLKKLAEELNKQNYENWNVSHWYSSIKFSIKDNSVLNV